MSFTRSTHCVFIALVKKEQVLGLSLIIKSEATPFLLSSFVISSDHRCQGYATILMKATKLACSNYGVSQLGVIYNTIWKNNLSWEKLLGSSGWDAGISDLSYVRLVDIKKIQSSRFIKSQPPLSAQMVMSALCPSVEAQLREALRDEKWAQQVPVMTQPFCIDKPIYRQSSFLLSRLNEIVGWIVVHELSDKVLQVTSLYIRPSYRDQQYAYMLVAEAIRRSATDKIAHFNIRIDNIEMTYMYQDCLLYTSPSPRD